MGAQEENTTTPCNTNVILQQQQTLPPIYPPADQYAQQQQQMLVQAPPQQQPLLYVHAPSGFYNVPGDPTMLVVPQGQPMNVHMGYIAPDVFSSVAAAPAVVYKSIRDAPGKSMAVAALVTFLVGFFTFVVYLASVIISLHMVRRGMIVKRKKEVLAFCILELLSIATVFAFGWYYEPYCYSATWNYSYYGTYEHCYNVWWGWPTLIVWAGFAVFFGIPRVIFTWHCEAKEGPKFDTKAKASSLALGALVTYLIGFFTFVTYLPSVIISLHMVRRGLIVKRKMEVIAFSVLELISIAFVCAFSWFYTQNCYVSTELLYSYSNDSPYPTSASYGDYYGCHLIWWGWISFVIWGVFALAFGIPRIIFTWNCEGKQAEEDSEIPNTFDSPMMSAPGYIYKRIKRLGEARNLALASLITFLIGAFTFIAYVPSIALSLHMVKKGMIVKRKTEVIAFSVLELCATAFVIGFGWQSQTYCDDYYMYYQGNRCITVWAGHWALIAYGAIVLAFGIPRIVFTWNCEGRLGKKVARPTDPLTSVAFSVQ